MTTGRLHAKIVAMLADGRAIVIGSDSVERVLDGQWRSRID